MCVAIVKSLQDKIVPVAVALSNENENYSGWKCFLEHLGEAILLVSQPHYITHVTYAYFTFVFNCDKCIE
jgi:hypothetical protein